MAVNPSAIEEFQRIQNNPVAKGYIQTRVAFHVTKAWSGRRLFRRNRPSFLLRDSFGNEVVLTEDDTYILNLDIDLRGGVQAG